MKAQGGPQKLRFTIVSFSGEDGDYPVRELLFHSPQTRGWQTPRFCKYPQEVVLKLEVPCKIQQIQILSHEYKIATKVEVFVASPQPGEDVNRAPFNRLGYLSFDSNERSNHQARELKSVHVSTPALYLRLVIHRCHVNKLNIYNQVGLIALNLIGEAVQRMADPPPGGYLQLHPPVIKEMPYYNQAAADVADLNLDIHVDTATAVKIRELARAKDMAVANEDYDEAKKLKASIDRLKVIGQKIAQLEARKRAAVEKEDYDTAKLIKADIDKLRSTGDSAAINSETYAPRPGNNPEDIFNRVLKTKGPAPLEEMPVGAGMQSMEESLVPEEDIQGGGDLAPEPSYGNVRNSTSWAADGSLNQHMAYDERPIQGKGAYAIGSESGMDGKGTGGGSRPGAQNGGGGGDGNAPHGWPSDLPAPEPLAGATAKDAESLEELAGEYCAQAFYSKNWQLREAALNYIIGQMKEGSDMMEKSNAFKILMQAVRKGMKDKVANVFLASLATFQAVIDAFSSGVNSKDVHGACEACLPLLLEKLADTNARLCGAARETIMFIAGLKDANLRQSTHLLVKPIKNQNAWRPVLGMLSVLLDLVPLFGISKSGDGFDLNDLMEFVGKAYNSPNADVRSMAVKVTKEVSDIVGPPLRKYMPKDINAKIKEQVEAILGSAQPSYVEPQAPSRAPAASSKSSAPASKAAPAAKGKSGGAKGSAPPEPPPPPPPMQTYAPDDPRPFEEELRERESRLGKEHPDVAESCSNLAILYNQKGLTVKALPLYERALAIYEKHFGPDHPEVAHTLTDLAVLHLEQGRDEVGRPLLERALVIQEQALGPDHPDVIAIKDVLNSE